MKNLVSASILSADFANLDRDIKKVEEAGVDMLHFDVMDGVFVNNISYGIPVLKSIRKCSKLIYDVHLMIINPEKYIKAFAEAGADFITFHLEACEDVDKAIELCKENNVKCGISIKPNTPVESLFEYSDRIDMALIMTVEPGFGGQGFIYDTVDKIKEYRKYVTDNNFDVYVQVDGGINGETAQIVKDAGANVLVSGNYLFGAKDPEEAVLILKK